MKLSEKGEVLGLSIVKSSGFQRLDKAVLDALRLGNFRAARDDTGQNIKDTLDFEFKFVLSGDR